jgi:hypothetical protein
MAFAANHLSTSDRNQPPEMCFGGNCAFLHHRKSVERLTPTTRTTSLVLIRASMPAKRLTTGGCLGLSPEGILLIGRTTSASGSCTVGGSLPAAFCRLETVLLGRSRLEGRRISRGLVTVLPGPLGAANAPGSRVEVFMAQLPTVAPVSLPDRCITLNDRAAISLALICTS